MSTLHWNIYWYVPVRFPDVFKDRRLGKRGKPTRELVPRADYLSKIELVGRFLVVIVRMRVASTLER